MSYDLFYRGLPRELRNHIYEDLLCPPEGVLIYRKWEIPRCFTPWKEQIAPALPRFQFPVCPYITQRKFCTGQLPHPAGGDEEESRYADQCDRYFWPSDLPKYFLEARSSNITSAHTSIFYTNRITYAEASAVFFERNVFRFLFKEGSNIRYYLRMFPAVLNRMKSISFTLGVISWKKCHGPIKFLVERTPPPRLELDVAGSQLQPKTCVTLARALLSGGTLKRLVIRYHFLHKKSGFLMNPEDEHPEEGFERIERTILGILGAFYSARVLSSDFRILLEREDDGRLTEWRNPRHAACFTFHKSAPECGLEIEESLAQTKEDIKEKLRRCWDMYEDECCIDEDTCEHPIGKLVGGKGTLQF